MIGIKNKLMHKIRATYDVSKNDVILAKNSCFWNDDVIKLETKNFKNSVW